MDMIYQTMKNLLKAFVNLFVAVIELSVGLINGVAALLLKIRPVSTGIKKEETESKSARSQLVKLQLDSSQESLVKQIRDELKTVITDRERYILAKTEMDIFEGSSIKKVFAGRKRRMVNTITRELLETEFKDCFLNKKTEDNTTETLSIEERKSSEETEKEDSPVEKAKIQAICEVSKEAIS